MGDQSQAWLPPVSAALVRILDGVHLAHIRREAYGCRRKTVSTDTL
ncbi:MAG: hypothetical protein ACRDS0_31555 [Pseudonocardiaceae bacterium]